MWSYPVCRLTNFLKTKQNKISQLILEELRQWNRTMFVLESLMLCRIFVVYDDDKCIVPSNVHLEGYRVHISSQDCSR